jgi:hypothetical protein
MTLKLIRRKPGLRRVDHPVAIGTYERQVLEFGVGILDQRRQRLGAALSLALRRISNIALNRCAVREAADREVISF